MVGHRIKHIVQETNTQNTTDYTYDANNRMTSTTTTANGDVTGTTRYYYDNNGNTIAEQQKNYTTGNEQSDMSLSGRIGTSTAKIYKYDAFNRLVQFNEGATEATYTYGADNLRNSKTVNNIRTDFVWNGQNLASEKKNDITTAYTYDPTSIVMSNNGTDTVRFIKDPHGNVIATSKNDKIVDSYDYTAFGVQLNSAETSNPFRYCGEYYDEELDSVYLRNRYYQPAVGRFINEDPIKDGLNWYNYCAGNPVMMIDPSGLGPQAMLRYIVEDKGGSVSWENGTISVTLNGITKSYNDLETINGRTIISSAKLAEDFGGEENDYIHDEQDRFESADDAALAFSLTYYEYSLYANDGEGVEYSSAIIKANDNGNISYYFDFVSKGDMNSSPAKVYLNCQVAIAHTHGANTEGYSNEEFSGVVYDENGQCRGDGYISMNYHIDNYLMTPNKKFKKLDKGWNPNNDFILDSNGFLHRHNPNIIPNNSTYVTNFN